MKQETINRFKNAKLLSVDIETKDPGLLDLGPGTHRGEGHICGVGFAVKENGVFTADYLSVAHPDTSQAICDRNRAIIRDILASPGPKLGTNIAYDAEWLAHEGMPINGKMHDIQYAEPLLNEYKRSYKLANLATDYGLRSKGGVILDEYADKMGWTGKYKGISNIWRMPTRVAKEYALLDVELPLEIFEKQKRMLDMQNLTPLYEIETDLIPVLLRMRQNGVRLDMGQLRRTIPQVADKHFELEEEIYMWAGKAININSIKQLSVLFDRYNIPYPRNPLTEKMKQKGITVGNPNIDKKVLFALQGKYPICKTILDYRHFGVLNNMFLHKYAVNCVDGRLFGTFHPLRSDDYGTVSGRFSASKPNLQQVSAKKEKGFGDDSGFNELTGQVVRKLFIPEEGKRWAKLDYSQVEYRIMAHYATGKGSDELRENYRNDKHMDYHQRVMDATGFDRRTSKNVNFGGMYGIGQKTAANLFGWSMDDAEDFLAGYHRAAPYIKATREAVSNVVARRGFLFTLLGRKARLHSSRKLHSMFNRLIQGTAADVMKKAMVDAEKSGVFDVLDLHITVHDELDVSYTDNKEGNEALEHLGHTMENAVKLDVPILVDTHTGANWAEAD